MLKNVYEGLNFQKCILRLQSSKMIMKAKTRSSIISGHPRKPRRGEANSSLVLDEVTVIEIWKSLSDCCSTFIPFWSLADGGLGGTRELRNPAPFAPVARCHSAWADWNTREGRHPPRTFFNQNYGSAREDGVTIIIIVCLIQIKHKIIITIIFIISIFRDACFCRVIKKECQK